MASSPPKPIVTSWDVFDTLLARFTPNPNAVFQLIEAQRNAPGFVTRRLDAQAALDRIGRPYVLHDIYRRMAADGLPEAKARALLRHEVETERSLLFPIRRNTLRVEAPDLIISDMYLPPELIAGFLFDAGELHTHLPIIRSNWGKHTGTIWPLVLAAYVIRRHVGDNPASDLRVPSGFGIDCELVQDSHFTPWETRLQELGLVHLALIQREVRLRCIPPDATAFHAAAVGPYLTVLVCFAQHLTHRFGAGAEFAFLSRSADEPARVFAGLFPEFPVRSLDISRRLTSAADLDPVFAAGITPATVVVDMVGTGRSFFRFGERNGSPGRSLILFAFLDLLLNPAERAQAERRMEEGRFDHVCRITGGGLAHWRLEHLLQAHYPPVSFVALDSHSGGVVRRFGAAEMDQNEARLVGWKSAAVTELVRTLRRRGLADPGAGVVVTAMEQALRAILEDEAITAPFTSFLAREKMDWA
jgi:hypothetical protein